LVRIRIRGSVQLCWLRNPDPALVVSDLQDTRNITFFWLLLFEGSLHYSSKIQRSHKTLEIKVFLIIFATVVNEIVGVPSAANISSNFRKKSQRP
jgi:hypothetical protein